MYRNLKMRLLSHVAKKSRICNRQIFFNLSRGPLFTLLYRNSISDPGAFADLDLFTQSLLVPTLNSDYCNA